MRTQQNRAHNIILNLPSHCYRLLCSLAILFCYFKPLCSLCLNRTTLSPNRLSEMLREKRPNSQPIPISNYNNISSSFKCNLVISLSRTYICMEQHMSV